MSPESSQHLVERIHRFQDFINTPEAVNFDDSLLWDYLSPTNQQLLTPVRQELRLHNACLNQVIRWRSHPYAPYLGPVGDSDYEHVVGMLKITHQLKDMGLSGFNFDDIEMKIVFHDSGEIITDDMSVIHNDQLESFTRDMKGIESGCFIKLILNRIKKSHPDIYQKVKDAYSKYENRSDYPYDQNSHLVKLIDTIQGDEYGIKHLLDPDLLNRTFKDGVYPSIDPKKSIIFVLDNENLYLNNILRSPISISDKGILLGFLSSRQAINYGQKDSFYFPEYLSHRVNISSL